MEVFGYDMPPGCTPADVDEDADGVPDETDEDYNGDEAYDRMVDEGWRE